MDVLSREKLLKGCCNWGGTIIQQIFELGWYVDKWLLLEYQRRSADSLPFEVDYHFDAVGDLYQGDAFVHSIVLAVEGHRPCNLA